MEAVNNSNLWPEYINFLLSPDTPLDFHVNVGDAEAMEKIGAVKWMLMARSKVLRVMLLESKMKHEGDLTITDIEPAIFKHFLVYTYGHDDIASLAFEDAVKLLNVAEKYDVQDLKSKIGSALRPKVTPDNAFTVLHHAAVCEREPKLWGAVTEVIQYQTEELFTNPQFRTLTSKGMVYILQQNSLSVPEIDVWKAALTWAKYQDEPVNSIICAQNMRSTLLPLLKHIRLCTLTAEQLCKEVLPTRILTTQEGHEIGVCIGTQKQSERLVDVCDRVKKRRLVSLFTNKGINEYTFPQSRSSQSDMSSRITVKTKSVGLQLCVLQCKSIPIPSFAAKGSTYTCEGKISITKKNIEGSNPPEEHIVDIVFKIEVDYDNNFLIPLQHNDKNIILKTNSKYVIETSFENSNQCCMSFTYSSHFKTTRHFDIECESRKCHFLRINYKTDEGSHCRLFWGF